MFHKSDDNQSQLLPPTSPTSIDVETVQVKDMDGETELEHKESMAVQRILKEFHEQNQSGFTKLQSRIIEALC